MKCILHIGTEKTGTTLIQEWLYSNEQELGRQGVYLSKLLGLPNNRKFSAYFENSIRGHWSRNVGIQSEKDKKEYFSTFEEDFIKEIKEASSNHHLCIISSEHLHSRINDRGTITDIRALLDKCFSEVIIICYFRFQTEMAVSLYSTSLKGKNTETLDEFLKDKLTPNNYYYDFEAIADNWSSVFGKANCIFKIYDRSTFVNSDIRIDFITSVYPKVQKDQFNFEINSSNEQLSPITASIFRTVNNQAPFIDAGANKVNSVNLDIKKELLKLDSLRIGQVTTPVSDSLVEKYKQQNVLFLEKYFPLGEKFPIDESNDLEDEQLIALSEVYKLTEDLTTVMLNFVSRSDLAQTYVDSETLLDISVKILRKQTLQMSDAIYLMKLAKRLNPNKVLIRNRLQKFKSLSRNTYWRKLKSLVK